MRRIVSVFVNRSSCSVAVQELMYLGVEDVFFCILHKLTELKNSSIQ